MGWWESGRRSRPAWMGVVAFVLALAGLAATQGDYLWAVALLCGAAWAGFNAAEVAWDVPGDSKYLRLGRRLVNGIFGVAVVWWAVATLA